VEGAVLVGEGEWGRVIGRLKQEVGEAAYRSWLKSMRFERVADGEGVIAVPTRFLRNWVATHYADRLLALWRTENEQVNRLAIIVEPRVAAFAQAKDEETVTAPAALAEPLAMPDIVEVGANLSAPLDPRFTFENFIVGKPNELAHAAARRVAEACVSPAHSVPFNPLFLYGGVGLGKTHLMHAIAWHVRMQAPGRKVIYLSAEKFMYQFIRALRFRSTMDFKDQFRSVDLLMIDDVQFISGKDSDLAGLEERMRSRLGWGLVADIHPTTYELRLGILQSKAEQSALRLPQKILEFLAHKIVSNVRELEGALNRIIAQMQLVGREITLEGAQDLLHDLLRANERRVTIDEIQRRVAEHFNMKMAEMTSSRRARAVARPRQVAMYLSKQLTSRSLPEIGRKFGGRDHTTVIHAVKKIEELIESDSALAEDVELLRRMLQS
jgi:chromosomal replication initiator protein